MCWWLGGGGVVVWRLHQIISVRIVFGGTCNDSKLELRGGYTKTTIIVVGHVREPLVYEQKSLPHVSFSIKNVCRACTHLLSSVLKLLGDVLPHGISLLKPTVRRHFS